MLMEPATAASTIGLWIDKLFLCLVFTAAVSGTSLYDECDPGGFGVPKYHGRSRLRLYSLYTRNKTEGEYRHSFGINNLMVIDGVLKRHDIIQQQCTGFYDNLGRLFFAMDISTFVPFADVPEKYRNLFQEIGISLSCNAYRSSYAIVLPRSGYAHYTVCSFTEWGPGPCQTFSPDPIIGNITLSMAARVNDDVKEYAEKHCRNDLSMLMNYFRKNKQVEYHVDPEFESSIVRMNVGTDMAADSSRLTCTFVRYMHDNQLSRRATCRMTGHNAASIGSVSVIDALGYVPLNSSGTKSYFLEGTDEVWATVDVRNPHNGMVCRCYNKDNGMTTTVPLPVEDALLIATYSNNGAWLVALMLFAACIVAFSPFAVCNLVSLNRQRSMGYSRLCEDPAEYKCKTTVPQFTIAYPSAPVPPPPPPPSVEQKDAQLLEVI
uniref:B40 protein n=1 Tax=Cardioderma bat herpesvirus TaxID=3141914 RepID=A0AAU7E1I7_9VIRU